MNIKKLQNLLVDVTPDMEVLIEDANGTLYDIVGVSSINKEEITFKIQVKDTRDIYEIFQDLIDNVKEFDNKFQRFKAYVNGGDNNDC